MDIFVHKFLSGVIKINNKFKYNMPKKHHVHKYPLFVNVPKLTWRSLTSGSFSRLSIGNYMVVKRLSGL